MQTLRRAECNLQRHSSLISVCNTSPAAARCCKTDFTEQNQPNMTPSTTPLWRPPCHTARHTSVLNHAKWSDQLLIVHCIILCAPKIHGKIKMYHAAQTRHTPPRPGYLLWIFIVHGWWHRDSYRQLSSDLANFTLSLSLLLTEKTTIKSHSMGNPTHKIRRYEPWRTFPTTLINQPSAGPHDSS